MHKQNIKGEEEENTNAYLPMHMVAYIEIHNRNIINN